MADKTRREKEIINNNINTFLKTTTEDYIRYYEGSPTYITYFQADDLASTHDVGLESVNSLTGGDSPKRYKKIYDVKVYGVDTLDIADQLEAGGLMTGIIGEIVFLPDSVRPYAGDFFIFDTDGMESHLFKIADVQFDRVTPRKFFRCQFTLYRENAEKILNNVISEYEVNYDSQTGNSAGIIESTEAATNDSAIELTDKLIDKYNQLFYDEDMDTFLYTDYENGENYWSPYLQHFLHDTKILSKNKSEILTEIYIMDINEIDNRNVYSEKLYRKSIFHSVTEKRLEILNENIFMDIKTTDLREIRNLPFFMSDQVFKVISPIDTSRNDYMAYLNAVNVLFGNKFEKFADVDHYHKVHKLDPLHLARIEPFIKNGDIIYECSNHELEPTQACIVVENKTNIGEFELFPLTLETLIKYPGLVEDSDLIEFIYAFINGDLTASSELLDNLDSMYFEPSIKNYILLPIIIYILKELY